MRALRLIAALAAVGILAVVVVSGGSMADPETPPALPGLPPPFLGTALAGSGALTAAIDSYGNVVDLRFPGPAGDAQIDNPYARQNAGTVPADTGIVVSAGVGGREPAPLWEADGVTQSYLPRTNVVVTVAALPGGGRLTITDAVPPVGTSLVRRLSLVGELGEAVTLRVGFRLAGSDVGSCAASPADSERDGKDADGTRSDGAISFSGTGSIAAAVICSFGDSPEAPLAPTGAPPAAVLAARADRRWVEASAPLGPGAPPWATRLYERSLLTLRALTDRKTGAVAAGARDGWAYVWPRDAATAALAFKASGHPGMTRRIAGFLDGLDLDEAARFYGTGEPVPDRPAQGDAEGWRRAADLAAGLESSAGTFTWRGRADYGERSGDEGDYLGNAIASGEAPAQIEHDFGSGDHLVRLAGDPSSTIDSAAAWAIVPFPHPALRDDVRTSLGPIFRARDRFGISPSLDWPGGREPWAAPTAWTAWAYAALGDRAKALTLLAALRRAETPAGDLPERVDARTGVPESTTPLLWPHAFAILALRELWPGR